MTLTVRLDPALACALDDFCAEHSLTKSLVVQESLASYLVAHASRTPSASKAKPSGNFRAFEEAGLLGCIAGPGGQADKATVRARVKASATNR